MAGESEPSGITPPEPSNQGASNRGHERPNIPNGQRQPEQPQPRQQQEQEQQQEGSPPGPANPFLGPSYENAVRSGAEFLLIRNPNLTPQEAVRQAEGHLRDLTNNYSQEAAQLINTFNAIADSVKRIPAEEQTAQSQQVRRIQREEYARQGISNFDKYGRIWSTAYYKYLERWQAGHPGQSTGEEIIQAAILSGNEAALELTEELLAAIEEDDASLRQEDIVGLVQAVNFIFSEDRQFRARLSTLIYARGNVHTGAFAAKYLGAEQFSQVPTNMLGYHWKSLLEATGVEKALELMEAKDEYGVKGAYWREPELKELTDERINNIDSLAPSGNFSEADVMLFKIIVKELKPKQILSDKDQKDYYKKKKKKAWEVLHKYKLVQAQFKTKNDGSREIPNDQRVKYVNDFNPTDKNNEALIKVGLFVLGRPSSDVYTRKNIPFTAVQELIRSNQEKYFGVADQLTREERVTEGDLDRKEKFQRLIYEIDRSFAIGERIHHTTLMSTQFDSLRWGRADKDMEIPEEFWSNEMRQNPALRIVKKGEAIPVFFNPKIEWTDPETKEKVILHLGTLEDDLKEKPNETPAQRENRLKLYRTIQNFTKQEHQTRVIAEVWHKYLSDFYEKYYDFINYDATISGKGPRATNRTVHQPATLSKKSEAQAGKAKFLRRFAEFGLMSAAQFFGLSSAKETLGQWDDFYQNMKYGWVPRFRDAGKIKDILIGPETDLLNSSSSLIHPWEALQKIKNICRAGNFTTKELDTYMDKWSRGVVRFSYNHAEQVGLENTDLKEADNILVMLRSKGVLSKHEEDRIIVEDLKSKPFEKQKKLLGAFGNLFSKEGRHDLGVWLRKRFYLFRLFRQSFSLGHGLWGLISRFLKEIFQMPR
ncbi:hypothetical protein HY025_02750 [Candidatus Daviesbacteria bacterium]|nr:hypothetical protein [Candidatus Daviesbacteria bacterium]